MEESKKVLAKVHDGICGAHPNGIALSQKILRECYFWPTMQVDAFHYAKSCKKCQFYSNLIHYLGCETIPSITYCPF